MTEPITIPPTEQPAEPTPVLVEGKPAKPPEQRISDILNESGMMLYPCLIAPVSKTPVPIVDFLSEYLAGGWVIDWRLAEQRQQ